MVKVTVAGGPDVGSVVTEVKAMRGVREGVANEIQDALAYDLDGSVRATGRGVIHRCVNVTSTVRQKAVYVLVQSILGSLAQAGRPGDNRAVRHGPDCGPTTTGCLSFFRSASFRSASFRSTSFRSASFRSAAIPIAAPAIPNPLG